MTYVQLSKMANREEWDIVSAVLLVPNAVLLKQYVHVASDFEDASVVSCP